MLKALDDEGEQFVANFHKDQSFYLEDPAPYVPDRQSPKGRTPSLCKTKSTRRWCSSGPPVNLKMPGRGYPFVIPPKGSCKRINSRSTSGFGLTTNGPPASKNACYCRTEARSRLNAERNLRSYTPIVRSVTANGDIFQNLQLDYLLSVSNSLLAFSQESLIALYASENPFFICSHAPAELFLKLPYCSASSFLCLRSAFRFALAF